LIIFEIRPDKKWEWQFNVSETVFLTGKKIQFKNKASDNLKPGIYYRHFFNLLKIHYITFILNYQNEIKTCF